MKNKKKKGAKRVSLILVLIRRAEDQSASFAKSPREGARGGGGEGVGLSRQAYFGGHMLKVSR